MWACGIWPTRFGSTRPTRPARCTEPGVLSALFWQRECTYAVERATHARRVATEKGLASAVEAHAHSGPVCVRHKIIQGEGPT